jgi:antirestriction protein ArdC
MTKQSLYEKQAQAILTLIEESEDKLVWQRPWLYVSGMPTSAHTDREYTGGNAFYLWLVQTIKGWDDVPYWATFNWIKSQGGKVNKGEKSCMIYFPIFKKVETKEVDEEGNPVFVSKLVSFRAMYVFNVKYQTTGMDKWVEDHTTKQEENKTDVSQSVDKLEKIYLSIKNRPTISHNGQRAYYKPSDDTIGLPEFKKFESNLAYWKTKFHELAHSTGHADRCNRKEITQKIGIVDNAYDREELVAEFTAMNILAFAGYVNSDTEKESAAYIRGWMKAFKEKPEIIQEAVQDSIKATEYLLKDYKER